MLWQSKKYGRSPLTLLSPAIFILYCLSMSPVVALPPNNPDHPVPTLTDPLDIDPAILEQSPVLQRWLDTIPDLKSEIETDPSFRPRLRLGYTTNPENRQGGIIIGVEDILLGQTGLALSGNYQTDIGDRDAEYGVNLRYYLLPLGHRVNLAPVVGYRSISNDIQDTDGVSLGLRMIVVPSRTGSADFALSQTWVNPGGDRQATSHFTLSAGYALTHHLRLASDIHVPTSSPAPSTTVGLVVEWLW